METFATRLKQIRIERNLTQKELAEILKTTDDSIYSWEKGRSQPSIEMIRELCRALDVTSDYLLGINEI